jgi:5-methylcytosine-specific restriction protein A
MAGSRTGTTGWLKLSKIALRRARAQGQTRCPFCGVLLNFEVSRQPNSAEPDHIIPHARGGTDTLENVQVICRRCNQSKGNRPNPRTVPPVCKPLRTTRAW